jgi:signal transduction histidine kinase
MPPRIASHIRLAAGLLLFGMMAGLGLAGILTRILPGLSVVLLIAALAGAAWYGRVLHRQCGVLATSARRWGEGNLAFRAALAGGSGLGSLGSALDRMAARLEARDEAARAKAQEQFIEAEKLATTGRLAAGVAHEINNPLGGILLCGDLLLESTAEDDPRRESMRQIVTQASRAREIVRGLLDFARQSPPQIERTDLNGVITEVLALLERQPLCQRMRVRAELSSVPLWIRCDVVKMEQVFINIVMNGLESMRPGGTLTVRTGFSERSGYCRAAISDTGHGIAPENISRIFEPFFTTKEVGQGLGLGLAISYGIVQQHQGEITVQSTVGVGTTFRVLLPVERE